MNTLKFTKEIHAPKEKVWEKLWSDASYRKWTAPFFEGSYAVSDWEQGSKILFLSPKGDGMFGIIETKIPYEQMIFKHLGEIKNGVEDPKDWAGARERYFLEGNDGKTILTVELDSVGEMDDYFKDTFPKALDLVKQISEEA
jgi:hypothetical protein